VNGGERCVRIISDSERWCFGHHPDRAAERSENAAKAARAKHQGSELSQVKQELRDIAAKVLNGEVSTAKGSVVGQLLGVYLRACETEMKRREQLEFEERLQALEAEQSQERAS